MIVNMQQLLTKLILINHRVLELDVKQQFDFLRDPLWQFVGVVVAIFAIIIPIWYYRRPIKSLNYDVVVNNQLITSDVQKEVNSKLRVLYDNRDVMDLRLVVIKIFNSGNSPITPSDYETPIGFNLGSEGNILEVSILNVQPSNIQPKMTYSNNRLLIDPLLLNPKDSITIKVLLDKIAGNISADARISGVKSIDRYSTETNPGKIFLRVFIDVLTRMVVFVLVTTILIFILSFF
jgi:hypothetical protein